MDSRTKIAVSVYALIYAAAAITAFRLEGLVPVPTIYILLSAIYVIPIWLGVTRRLSVRLGALFLVATPLLPAMIVVDPLEVGFYGYDPYVTLQTALEFRTDGPIEVARNWFAWPLFYAFLWIVTSIVGVPIEIAGKYLPLISVITPLLLFLFARRVTTTRTAFIAAMGFAGVRTLYAFQVKFIDETPAFILFFALLLLLVVRVDTGRRSPVSYLALAVALGAVLTHHYVGALVGLVLVLWDLSRADLTIPSRVREIEWPFSRLTSTTGLVFVAMFLVVAPQFLGFLGSVADLSTSVEIESAGGSQTQTAENGGQSQVGGSDGRSQVSAADERSLLRFWQLVIANLVLLAILSLVVLGFRQWIVDAKPALLAIGTFGGLLYIGFGYSVVFGPIIPLDPSRYLLYMIGTLLIVSGFVLESLDWFRRPSALFSMIAVLLVVTQLVLIPPAVLYSSQAETVLGEDHYSPSQFDASEWVAEYGGEEVVGWERGLWLANGIHRVEHGTSGIDCAVYHVWRRDAPGGTLSQTAVVTYNNGEVMLYHCTS